MRISRRQFAMLQERNRSGPGTALAAADVIAPDGAITLPWPPSVNRYWRTWQGRMLISADGRAYRSTVTAHLRIGRIVRRTGPLAVAIMAYPPDQRRRDLDNLLKSLLDSMQHGGAYVDDYQIRKLTIERGDVADGGRVVVRISEVSTLTPAKQLSSCA